MLARLRICYFKHAVAVFLKNFGSRDELECTGEVAVGFNGATSPIWGTFHTQATFVTTPYPISFIVIEGSQYEAILGLDFLDKHAKSIEPSAGRILLCGGETIEISKRKCDSNKTPVLCCKTSTVVPPISRGYLPCTVLGETSSSATVLCIDDTIQFTADTGLMVAHSMTTSTEQTCVEVLNLSKAPISIQEGATINVLEECERIPYSVNKLQVCTVE